MDPAQFAVALHCILADSRLMRERQRWRAAFSPDLSFGRHFGPPLPTARPAAVMALIETVSPNWSEWNIPLTVRALHLPSHPGQISLPGGQVECDESPQQAAEREFCEELGLPAFPGNVIGSLQPLYVYNSDFLVTPHVALSSHLGDLVPCEQEVSRVVRLPLGVLLSSVQANDSNTRATFQRGAVAWTARVIDVGEDRIWGATAIILGELSAVIAQALNYSAEIPG
ncbi:MAG: CoA pyrophosphatase [Pirellulaceae bacterium]